MNSTPSGKRRMQAAPGVRTAKHTIWASGCRSWYLDADDLPTAWPWTSDRFREEMRKPRFDDYEMR